MKILKNLFKVNLYLCAGIIIVDGYHKLCEMSNTIKELQNIINEG